MIIIISRREVFVNETLHYHLEKSTPPSPWQGEGIKVEVETFTQIMNPVPVKPLH